MIHQIPTYNRRPNLFIFTKIEGKQKSLRENWTMFDFRCRISRTTNKIFIIFVFSV